MELLAIQNDVLVNPQRISVIEKKMDMNGSVVLSVIVDGRTYEVRRPINEFMQALNQAGVDLTKQFFAV